MIATGLAFVVILKYSLLPPLRLEERRAADAREPLKMNRIEIARLPLVSLVLLFAFVAPGNAQREEHLQVLPSTLEGHVLIGSATAIDGDWAVVADYGATTHVGLATGSCVVYRRSELGWTEWQTLVPPTDVFLQHFGYSIALHGTELVVGARRGGHDNSGRVFVYHLIGDQWEEVQQLRAFDGGPGFVYGHALAFDDQTLVVGSMGYPDETYVIGGSGTAYVYDKQGSDWVFGERIPLPDHNATPHSLWGGFGWSCAIEDDLMVIGAPGNNVHGMAFVYRRGSSGWDREADLYLPQFSPDVQLRLGYTVAISNGIIAVGAPIAITALFPGPSTVAFFEYDAITQGWGLMQTVRASDWQLTTGDTDQFGYSMEMVGDRLVVGAMTGSYTGLYDGTAYLFERSNGIWNEVDRLIPSDPNPPLYSGSAFGCSVALDGKNGRVLIGARNFFHESEQSYDGKAYFYDLNAGSVVCAGGENLTLEPTLLTITGSRQVSDSNLALSVYDAPPELMGIYLVGPGGPPLPFGANGSLCVGQPFSRLTGIKSISAAGSAMYQIDFTAEPASSLIQPGSTLTFQFAHRDKIPGTSQPTINASDAVEVTFE